MHSSVPGWSRVHSRTPLGSVNNPTTKPGPLWGGIAPRCLLCLLACLAPSRAAVHAPLPLARSGARSPTPLTPHPPHSFLPATVLSTGLRLAASLRSRDSVSTFSPRGRLVGIRCRAPYAPRVGIRLPGTPGILRTTHSARLQKNRIHSVARITIVNLYLFPHIFRFC